MTITQNGSLKRDDNDYPVMGGTSSSDNATIINSAFDPITRRLLTDTAGGGSGTVTEVDTGTGLTGGPITTTGTISLDSKLAPLDTLGSAGQLIRVNAAATALEYFTSSAGGVASVVGTANRISVNSTDPANPVVDIAATYVGQSSITTLGTITTGVWTGTTIAIANGGTGQTAKAAAFNALSPMTTGGDIIYGGASGAGTRLANGSSGQVLTSGGTTVAPTWTTITTAGLTVGTSTITSGTTTRILYDNAGVLGEYTLTGSGTVVAMAASPTFTGTPAAPTQATGDNTTAIATDAFVQTAIANAIAGVNPAIAVSAATTGAANTSAWTYSNGVSGVGATFTGPVNTAIVIDGITYTAPTQSLLVKDDTQSPSGAFNGIYNLTALQTVGTGAIFTRRIDYDTPSDINNTGAIPVLGGTVNALTSWLLNTTVVTVGTTPITYTQFSFNPSRITPPNLGGTGIANNAASTLTISGNFATTLTVTASTGVTLPTSGTLVSSVTTGNGVSATNTGGALAFTLGAITPTTVNGNTFTTGSSTYTGTAAQTYTFPTTTATIARTDAAQTFTGIQTVSLVNTTPQTLSVTSNAATADISHGIQNFTNSSASAMTITLATASAVDGQFKEIRIYDFSAVAEGITWVNTENSTVTAPATSNGSTTLPLSVLFQFNSATSKWRCIATA